jgi:mannose-1-phosphate guanylyltransferase
LPKPMIPLVRKPVMEFLVEHLKAHGVKQIMVNTSHFAPEIEEYFRDGDRLGVQMAYCFEGGLVEGQMEGRSIGTAGVMKNIQDFSGFFDQTFVVLSGDAWVDVHLGKALHFHRERKSIATLVLRGGQLEEASKYGAVQTDGLGRVIDFQENPARDGAVSSAMNTGIYIFEPEIFRYIPAGVQFDLAGQLLPELVRNGENVFAMTLPFTWLDVGSVPDYWEATGLLLGGKIPGFTLPGEQIRPGIHCGINVGIPWDRVRIEGPVYIGSSSSVGEGATIIGPTVIGSGCVIQPGATVRECILADYTRISSLAALEKKLIFGSKCLDPSGRYLDIEESGIRWLMDDARVKEDLSPEELELMDDLKSLTASRAMGGD